jgi:hypothetical protein
MFPKDVPSCLALGAKNHRASNSRSPFDLGHAPDWLWQASILFTRCDVLRNYLIGLVGIILISFTMSTELLNYGTIVPKYKLMIRQSLRARFRKKEGIDVRAPAGLPEND